MSYRKKPMKKKSPSKIRALTRKHLTWETAKAYAFILVGALVQAIAMRLFLIPSKLVSGGISGISQLVNSYTGWPVGLMVLVGNIPLFILGWRYLGGPRFALRTAVSVVAFSLFTDLLVFYLPTGDLTQDVVLNTLYGGVVLGVGLGLVYRGQGTSGGSDILGRILNHKYGISISQSYLATDSLVVLSAGFVFGWTLALYALVMIYVSGVAAELASEGSSIYRAAMIITNETKKVSDTILTDMERGVTILEGTGAYTKKGRPVLYCVITQSETHQLKALVQEIDPDAFMVIGHVHEALGEGFKSLNKSVRKT
jgi:uncharacterized membrane-anchored protein YitT (DUF2179 family)